MAQKCEWLVILPDRPNALADRMKVRPDHLENLKPQIDAGFWVMGGATLDSPPQEGQGLAINGSVMMALASSKEEVLERVKTDVYATTGVWDMDKVQVIPFKSAVRKALL
ncbi:hypothetical protein MBLNU457_3805t2 [Dothideomycetes sp. NU457]